MSKSLGLTLMALAFTVTYVSACSCLARSAKQIFCNDDFAILFKIGSNTTTGLDRVYEVEMLKTYRRVRQFYFIMGSDMIPYTDIDEEKLYTRAETAAACGVSLIKDAYYVVSGKYEMKSGYTQMRTSTCELQRYLPKLNDKVPKYTPPECDTTEPGSQYSDAKP